MPSSISGELKKSFRKIYVETSWQDLCNRSLCNVCTRYAKEVSWQDLCQDLGKKSLGKTREEISLQEVFTEEEDAEQRVDFGVLQAFLMAVC